MAAGAACCRRLPALAAAPPQAERYVCSVPRERYSLLGHRAALVLAGDAEAADFLSSFLKGTDKEEVRRGRGLWRWVHGQRWGDACGGAVQARPTWCSKRSLALSACSAFAAQSAPPNPRVLPLLQATSDRVGEQLAASKSREVDAILGSHASDEVGVLGPAQGGRRRSEGRGWGLWECQVWASSPLRTALRS